MCRLHNMWLLHIRRVWEISLEIMKTEMMLLFQHGVRLH